MSPKLPTEAALLESLKTSLSDLESVRLVSPSDPKLVALKRGIRVAIITMEPRTPPVVVQTREMRQLAIEMREKARAMQARAVRFLKAQGRR
jgi:predicted component of type VI protein secretion system